MKEKLKTKKIYVIIFSCLAVAVVITGIVIWLLSGQESVSKVLSLGDNYLSSMDYEAAIREYKNALQIDPKNEEALVGLAKSYAGMGDQEMAEHIFKNDLAQSQDADVWRSYAEWLEDTGDYISAAGIINQIIDKEDKEEDYQWLDEVLEKVLNKRYEYATNNGVELSIKAGEVLSKGNNVLGQLGTETNMGTWNVSEQLKAAGFQGLPQSVYTTGSNSYVVDQGNHLWVAGSNRSGQKTAGSVQMISQSGWAEDTTLNNVMKVTGNKATVFALTSDGTLWMRGSNLGYMKGAAWTNEWVKIYQYGKVLDVQCTESSVAILTIDGKLYQCNANSYYIDTPYVSRPEWNYVNEDVEFIALGTNGNLVYLKQDGEIGSYYYGVSVPESWYVYDNYTYMGKYVVPFEVTSMVVTSQGIFMVNDMNELYFVDGSSSSQIKVSGVVDYIYSGGDNCVVQLENGGYVLLDAEGNERS